jgi:hypothetical protein
MFLEPLKEKPKDIILYLMFIAGFTLFVIINVLIFQPLGALVPTYNILDYEFAWTAEQVLIIFAEWGTSGRNLIALSTYWDFLYIVGYVMFAFAGVLLVTRHLPDKFHKIGLYTSFISILSGLFDVIENIFLLIMIGNVSSVQSLAPLLAGIMATIKFSALFIAAFYFLIGLFIIIVLWIKNK